MVVTAKYDDNTTAIVSNYQVTPNTPLTLEDTTITITYREIGVSASATVDITVKNVLRKIEITTPPYTVDYYVDDTFDNTGMIVEAFYSDGSHKPVTTYTWEPTRALTEQDNTITISYTEDGVTATTYQDITVGEAPDLVSIAITNPPDKTVYKLNEYFDRTGMIVTATFADGKSRIVSGYSVSPNGALGKTDTTITVSYTRKGITKTATQAITVVYLTSIVISNPPTYTEYYEGNSFNKAGMVVTAIYSNDTTVILKDTDYTVTPEVLDTHTTQVVITYSDNGITKTATQAVKVTYYPYDYTKSMVLSQSGTYRLSDLQATHRNIRIVTIAGGTGATNGEAGTAGGSSDGSRISRGSSGTDTSNPGAGGTGGHAGSGSSGGAVYSQDIVLDTNASDIVVTIGNGGANASYGGVGSTGGETKAVIDGVTISSNKGSSIDTGYQDIFTKIIYAKKGVNGVAGGNGGTGGNSNDGQSGNGTGVDSWTGGTGSSGWTLTTDYRDNKYTETHNTRERSTDKKSYKQQTAGWMEGYTNYRLNDDGTVSFSGRDTIGKTNSTTVYTGTIYQNTYTPSAPTSPSTTSIASHAKKITVSNPSKNNSGVLCYDEDSETHYWETIYKWTNNIVNVAAGYSRWGGTGAVYGSNGTNGGASAPTPPTPSAPNAPDTFGSGGNGGHGGAGGGGAPATRAEIENRGGSGNSVCNNSVSVSGQSGGSGSNGSAGTAGAQGCIIVYYS